MQQEPPARHNLKARLHFRRAFHRLLGAGKISRHYLAIGNPWKVADVAEALGISARTIEHLKARFVEEGLEAALARKAPAKAPKLTFDGAFDARLTALACSPAPEGRARWTVRLLAEKVVELKIAPKVSTMSVHRALKKTRLSLT